MADAGTPRVIGSVKGGLSPEEEAKLKAEINEFEDAVEDETQLESETDENGNFKVTAEELSIIRAELACEFPEDYKYLSDAYILSVASKPYSKNPKVRRPLEYSMEKLTHVMEWRAEAGAPEMENLVKIASGPESEAESPEQLAKAKALATSLNYGSTYWHGHTKDGRPILWVRTNRKPWYPDVDAEINALMVIADAGIREMPEGITDFVCISDSASPPPPNPSFMIGLLKALVRGYPDRLNMLISAPISSIIQFVMSILLPLMPGRLANKVFLKGLDDAKEKLVDILPNGEEDIPTFFGGPADHDLYYPDESKCPNRGEGDLKFDYFGMVERLEKSRKEWVESQEK